MSRANLQPRAICRTSTSDRPSSKMGVMPTSVHEKEIVVSVVLVIVGGGEVTAGPHGTASVGLRLKRCVRSRRDGTCIHKHSAYKTN